MITSVVMHLHEPQSFGFKAPGPVAVNIADCPPQIYDDKNVAKSLGRAVLSMGKPEVLAGHSSCQSRSVDLLKGITIASTAGR